MRVEIVAARCSADLRSRARKRDRLGRRRERRRHRARLGQRLQLRQPRRARRRLREAADRLDNPIEFEGPQGAGVHAS